MALLTAQKMGDDMLTESKQKSQEIINNAENMAKSQLGNLAQDIADEEEKLATAKKKTAEYVTLAKEIIFKYSECLDRLDEISAPPVSGTEKKPEPQQKKEQESAPADDSPAADKHEEDIVDTAKEINKNISDLLRDDPTPSGAPDSTDEPTVVFRTKDTSVNWADDDEPTSPRPKFNFDDLQFGANYSDKTDK